MACHVDVIKTIIMKHKKGNYNKLKEDNFEMQKQTNKQ